MGTLRYRAAFAAGLWLAALPVFGFDSIHLQQTITAPALKNFTPTGVAFDSNGQLWVTDPKNNQLDLFSSSGTFLRSIGHAGKQPGEFQTPYGIAVGPDARVYVADSGNARVDIFSADGQWQDSFGEKGSGLGQFREPWAIAIGMDGTIAVSDRDSSHVQLFSPDGIFLQQFDAGGPADAVAISPTGYIYTLQLKTRTLQAWSPVGQPHGSVTGEEPGVAGFDEPGFLATGRNGFLYVSDAGSRQFRELDRNGRTRGSFGRKGSGEGQFRAPAGIAVSDELLAVADTRNRAITLLRMEHTEQSALPPMPIARLQVHRRATLPAVADALAVNADGSLHTLSISRMEVLTWNLTANTTSAIDLRKTVPPFRNPSGITTAPSSGSLFIADAALDRVFKLDRQGKTLLEFGKHHELSKPHGMSCSPKGILLIADTGKGQFEAYNHQALFQFSGGEKTAGPGQLKAPSEVAWDKDQVYVADPGTKKVVTFTTSGRFVRETGPLGGDTLEDPRAVAVDREGHLFVLDAVRGRVLVFDSTGLYLGGFGTQGQSAGFFNKPKAFALSDSGDLYVAEANRIQVFHVVLLPPTPQHVTAVPGEGFVTLKWDAVPTRFPAQYVVYRSSAGASATVVKQTLDTTWTDDTLTPKTTFAYLIAAQSTEGATSAPSLPTLAAILPITSGPRVDLSTAQINGVFSANYKFYGREPFGRVTLHNTTAVPAQKVGLSIMVQEYMDFPSEAVVGELHPDETREVPLTATFNNKVLSVTETTPVQAQLKVTWYSGERQESATFHQSFLLYSRNTLRWDLKERVAAFITPNDPPVLDFARGVTVPFSVAHAGAPLPNSVLTAWSVFSGLSTYGMSYLPRPNNPYDRVSLDSSTVDTMQFPRETLRRKSGDCADVVALLAAALESMTLNTAVIDVPGHLFLMVDTGESRREALALPEHLLVPYAGTWWIPIEATLLGDSFTNAWKKGAEEYQRWNASRQLTIIDTHHAWGTFEPATLPDQPADVTAPTLAQIEGKFLPDWKALAELRWQTAAADARAAVAATPASGAPWLQLGLIAIDYKKYDQAAMAFTHAKDDPATAAAALNDLGNLAFIKEDWTGAEKAYQSAAQKDATDARVLVNLARAQKKLGKTDDAQKTFALAIAEDATLKAEIPSLEAL